MQLFGVLVLCCRLAATPLYCQQLIFLLQRKDGKMDQEVSKKSTVSGENPLTKDRFGMISKVVAIIGGLISAIALIISLNDNTNQRARELQWNQAKLAAELEDDIFINDPKAFNALRMTDWGAYDFIIEGTKVMITSEEVQEALNIEKNNELTPKGVFVRESFDRLFYRIGKIERAVKSKLIRFEDVYSPMDYYVPFLRSTHGQVLIPYMQQLHHTDALKFMKRFDTLEIDVNSQPTLSQVAAEKDTTRIKKRLGRSRRQRTNIEPEISQRPAKEDLMLTKKVKEIIVNQLGVDENEVTLDASFINDLGADILDTVELVMAFEEEFDILIPDEDAEKLNTVGDAISYLEKKISEKGQ